MLESLAPANQIMREAITQGKMPAHPVVDKVTDDLSTAESCLKAILSQ
jgi:hypothetical protein